MIKYFISHKNEILSDKSRSFKFIKCFNKSKETLLQICEELTSYFCDKINSLAEWFFNNKHPNQFEEFSFGCMIIFDFCYDLFDNLLHFWAEDDYKKSCLEKILFNISLVWKTLFEKISQIREITKCKI